MTQLNFDQKNIKELLKQCLHHNIATIFLTYCVDGKPRTVFDVLKPIFDDCVKQLMKKTIAEIQAIVKGIPTELRFMVEPVKEPLLKENIVRIAEYCIAGKIRKSYYSISKVLKLTSKNSPVILKCPELKKLFDENGLLLLNDDFELFEGGIKYGEYLLHYHQFFRKGFFANPNLDFISAFKKFRLKTKENNKFRIAIDHRRIMKFADYQGFAEHDIWFGPKFAIEALDDISKIGLAVIYRSQPSPFEITNSLVKTEFLWKSNEGEKIKTLEIEETGSIKYLYDNWHINRYIHTERDTANQTFRQLDGAVKLYEPSNYQNRIAEKMPNQIKSKHYIKLFRIEGHINLENWLSLLSMFYTGNEMVIEYFDPALFENKFRPIITQYQDGIAKNRRI